MIAFLFLSWAAALLVVLTCSKYAEQEQREEECEEERAWRQEKAAQKAFDADVQQMAAAMRDALIIAGLKGGE